jgi:abnormal spindle-like microcephaly-associated protein
MSQVRFPSDKRPVQLHNSALALATLSAAGVAVDALPTSRGLASLTPEDLVDGDRERSLALLWAVARALQLPRLVPIATLRAELARVLARGRRLRRQQQQQLSEARLNGAGAEAGAAPLVVYMKDELVSLLLQWVQAVAAQQGVAVQNFTSCFGDGRVLCLLVSGGCASSTARTCWCALIAVQPILGALCVHCMCTCSCFGCMSTVRVCCSCC